MSKLEKRLDPHLRYLRNASQEYNIFPLDMKPEYILQGAPVFIDNTKVKLNLLLIVGKIRASRVKGYNDRSYNKIDWKPR